MSEHAMPVTEDELTAYVDGRLTPDRQQAVDRFLAQNPAAQARVAADKTVRDSLRQRLQPIMDLPIPDRLRVDTIRRRQRAVRAGQLRIAAACVGFLAIGSVTGWIAHDLNPLGRPTSQQAALSAAATDAIIAHRIFVVEKLHPVEVGAAQETHLVQWLSRRVGHTLAAPNLTEQGYALMGGRLLPASTEAAAQFMYQSQTGQRLTVYVRAAQGDDTRFQFVTSKDVAAFSWIDQGLGFAIVGAIDRPALLDLADTVYEQLDPHHRAPPADL